MRQKRICLGKRREAEGGQREEKAACRCECDQGMCRKCQENITLHNRYMEKEMQRDKLCSLVLFRLRENEHSKMQISPVLQGKYQRSWYCYSPDSCLAGSSGGIPQRRYISLTPPLTSPTTHGDGVTNYHTQHDG